MTQIEKIRKIEKAAGGQANAAKLAGVRHNTWWRWAAGRAKPNAVLIDMLYYRYVCDECSPDSAGARLPEESTGASSAS